MRRFNQNSGENEMDRTAQREKAINTRPHCVLEAFECIVELAANSNLSDEFFSEASKLILYCGRKLKLNPVQVALLAVFVDRSEDNSIRLSEIAGYLGCRTTRILRLSKEIDVLEAKHYVVASRSRKNISYRVPAEAIKALKENGPYVYEPAEVTGLSSFFDVFDEYMESMDEHELDHEKLLQLTVEALDSISESVYAQTLKRMGLDDEDRLLFTYMAHLFVENNDDNILFSDIENIYDDRIPRWCKCALRDRSSILFRNNLIENVNENGMARSDAFKLTDQAKNELLGEIKLNTKASADNTLLKHSTFAEKKLIYNSKEGKQIGELASILTENRFREVQQRLEKAGMRKGFCCLFYGAPGTGKTETVYQLARLTGRDIMRVDVDKIKSCWVGESEKNIKALFDRYRNICRQAEIAPILLFNEADAVLGVRMEGASKAVDKMENSIQNIILQEMESLDGIMIATTNLTTNLDKAFERRFLYKVCYEKPTEEARAHIWQAMLPGLADGDARTLAAESDLSGGEIENIVRKQSVAAILSGSDIIDVSALRKLCRTERIGTAHTRVGF